MQDKVNPGPLNSNIRATWPLTPKARELWEELVRSSTQRQTLVGLANKKFEFAADICCASYDKFSASVRSRQQNFSADDLRPTNP